MGKMASILAAPARPQLLAFRGFVYEVQRASSDALSRVGYAVLEGEASVKAAEREIREDLRKLREVIKATPPEEREAARERLERQVFEKQVKRLELMQAKPEQQIAMLERCNAYICAAVVGAGKLLPEYEDTPIGVIEAADPAAVLVDLRSEEEIAEGKRPSYVEPIRYVQTLAEQDVAKGLIWVRALPEEDREALGSAIISLQGVAKEIKPFRLGPSAAREDRRAGEEVRADSSRGDGVDAATGGAGGGVPSGGPSSQGAPGKRSKGNASRRR